MTRVGMGFDVHRLVEGRELWLGGVNIPWERGLLGHSDADVAIHALCDALLGAAALRDIGYHFPDTDPAYEDATQLAEFASFLVSTDQEQATGNALPESVTYGDVTYTNDTAEYRLAKFKAEIGNYTELQSAMFYYLFTELFLMVDSRAKNAFPSFIGTEVVSA